ncbi:MAG: Tad domain-containing protein [Planctomycetes bacterium]|nr:Tad domain-containing protein [Planctomycetota bacterium]
MARRTHRNQSGTISILSVFAVLLLTMLLGMVMNVGRQVDGKIRLQNAADAAAYSGGLVLARGMNSLAFTNHLLCEVFAMTAFMREARDRHADKYVPDILEAWEKEAPVFSGSGFEKFENLGPAISQKVPLEQELVRSYSEWAAAVSDAVLPLMEKILGEPDDPTTHLIPEYQRAVVEAIPDMAQHAAMTVAALNGQPDYGRGPMLGVLWHAGTRQAVGGDYLASLAVNPNGDAAIPAGSSHFSKAREQRDHLANTYLTGWNYQVLAFFDYGAKMSQFASLWRGFTCGQLRKLLDEYPDSNLPFMIETELQRGGTLDYYETYMAENLTFLAVVYWGKAPGLSPGLFRSPIAGDALGFAQVRVFVPTSRLVWGTYLPASPSIPMGGPPGYQWPTDTPSSTGTPSWGPTRQSGVSTSWDLLNQHWTCQLVPAVHANVLEILQTPPPVSMPGRDPITLPNLAGMNSRDLEQISYH